MNTEETKAQMGWYTARYNKWQLAGFFLLGVALLPYLIVKKLLGRGK